MTISPSAGDTGPIVDTTAVETPAPKPFSPLSVPVLPQQSVLPPVLPPVTVQSQTHPVPQQRAFTPSHRNPWGTFETLKRLIKEWPSRKVQAEKPQGKDYQKLAGDSRFSSAFEEALGKTNVHDIQGIDDGVLAIAVFEALVEEEAQRQVRARSNQTLQDLLSVEAENFWVESSFGPDGKVRWCIKPGYHEGSSIVDLVCIVFSISRMDALATLAGILKMQFENIVQLSSATHVATDRGFERLDNTVPRFLELSRHGGYAELINIIHIKGSAGQIVGAIAQYRYGERIFCLPATVGRRTLSIGLYKATAFWLDQREMDERPAATIVLCQDIRTAIALQKILAESRSTGDLAVIVTGHLFDDLSILPWNYLYGHDVVFVPAPTKQCMAMVKGYRDYVLGAGAKSFRVATHVLLHSKPGFGFNSPDRPGLSSVEAELLGSAVFLDEVDRPVWVVRQVVDTAITYGQFDRWGQEAGVFKRPKQAESANVQTKDEGLKIFDPGSIVAAKQPSSFADVRLSQIAPAGGIVMVHGVKNAGKSTLVFALIRAVIFTSSAFGFQAEGPPAVVYLLDSETPRTLLSARIEQNGLVDTVNIRLFPISKMELLGSGEQNIVLTNIAFRARLEAEMDRRKANFLVIDNLTTLASPGGIYQQHIAGEILDWAAMLTMRGITTVVVHHSDQKNGKRPKSASMRGSMEFSIRAHTEIVVIGREQILDDENLGGEKVQAAAVMDGTTLGIHFRFIKMACVLEGHTLWFHLPLSDNATWNLLAVTGRGGELIDTSTIPPTNVTGQTSCEVWLENDTDCVDNAPALDGITNGMAASLCDGVPTHDLTDDEQKVVAHVRTVGKIQTKGVCKLLGCAETKGNGILKTLVDNCVFERFGKGRATAYRLAD